jgi:hypothetical protein
MVIKSQQDIKNQTRAKGEKVPKVFENVAQKDSRQVEPQQDQPIVPLIQRVENIETYLKRVDLAFEKIVTELDTLGKSIRMIDSEISKLTGDMIRLTKLEEDRYVELANAINTVNDKLHTIDEFVPVFVDQRINDYFEDLASSELPDEAQSAEQENKP